MFISKILQYFLMGKIEIISGSQANALAQQVANQLGIPHYSSTIRYFPDGELYLRLPTDVKDKKIILFESFARRPNDALVETVFLSETLHDKGADEVILVPHIYHILDKTPSLALAK
jgi:ribose-phosphate pyrophosphokinase